MSKASDRGRRGEDVALEWLQAHGLVLRERNWRWNHKEIDLIMESERWLHVVEVKTLRAPAPIEPWEQVGPEKQRNLILAADHYARQRKVVKEVHFDIVSVLEDERGEMHVEYIPEAFFAIG